MLNQIIFGRRSILLHLSGYPCQYHRRVVATKFTTSNIIWAKPIYCMYIIRPLFFFVKRFVIPPAAKNKIRKLTISHSDSAHLCFKHNGGKIQMSYPQLARMKCRLHHFWVFVDILFIFLFHSTATFAIMILSFKIHGCVSPNVKYIFIRYGLSAKTFQ